VGNIYLAIKSRVGTRLHYQKGQRIVAWNIASLWQRSYQLNEAVYNAMLSRGYTGEPVIFHSFKVTLRDWVWLACVTGVCALLVYWEHWITG
jgi:cobalt/nickel transport system permease protein